MNTRITLGNTAQAFFILSAARASLDKAEVEDRTDTLLQQIRGIGYPAALCNGHYDGRDEPSIIVVDRLPNLDFCRDTVLRLAGLYGQESVLQVDEDNAAQLIFCDGAEPQSLGKFTAVPERIAKRGDAYTERLGWYYICIPARSS